MSVFNSCFKFQKNSSKIIIGSSGLIQPKPPVGSSALIQPKPPVGSSALIQPKSPVGSSVLIQPKSPVGSSALIQPKHPVGSSALIQPKHPVGSSALIQPSSPVGLSPSIPYNTKTPKNNLIKDKYQNEFVKKKIEKIQAFFQTPEIQEVLQDKFENQYKKGLESLIYDQQLKRKPSGTQKARIKPDYNGLHFMEKNTKLDGFFTFDVKEKQGEKKRGRARILYKTNENDLSRSEPIGLVDTHSSTNVMLWKDVEKLSNAIDQKTYSMVQNKNGEYIGVKLIHTNPNHKFYNPAP